MKAKLFRVMMVGLLFTAPIVYGLSTVTTDAYKEYFPCNGSSTTFVYSWPGLNGTDIEVRKRTIATGVEVTLTPEIEYTVSATNNDYSTGGTVTTTTAYASTYQLVILRKTPHTQPTQIPNSTSTTNALNRLVLMIQELSGRVDRSVKAPETDSALDMNMPSSIARANKYAAYDANGRPTASAGPIGDSTVPISPYIEGALNLADANELRVYAGAETRFQYNVMDYAYGATINDGTTDATAAINRCINAVPWGGTVFLPNGVYKVTATLQRSDLAPWGMEGSGIHSIIKPALTDNTTDVIVMGQATGGGLSGGWLSNFTIASSTASSCRNAISINQIYYGYISDVLVACDHTEAAILLKGAEIFTVERPVIGVLGTGDAYARGKNGIVLESGDVQCNDIWIRDAKISTLDNYALYAAPAMASTRVEFSGNIQECGASFYLEGMSNVNIHDCYIENSHDSNVIDGYNVTFNQVRATSGQNEVIHLDNCEGVTFTNNLLPNVKVDSDCNDVHFGGNVWYYYLTGDGAARCTFGDGLEQNISTFLPANPAGRGQTGSTSPTNLWTNADFRSWAATAPTGWSVGAGITWTQCGTGLTDTNNVFTSYCAKIATTSYLSSTYTMPLNARLLAEAKVTGRFSFNAWFRTKVVNASQQPYMRITVHDAAGDHTFDALTNGANDVWQMRGVNVLVDATADSISFVMYGNGTWYVACPTLTVGRTTYPTWIPSSDGNASLQTTVLSADRATVTPGNLYIINTAGGAIDPNLVDGAVVGDRVKFVMKVAGNNFDLNVLHHVTSDPEVIRLDTAKEWVELVWDGTDYVEVSGNGQSYP